MGWGGKTKQITLILAVVHALQQLQRLSVLETSTWFVQSDLKISQVGTILYLFPTISLEVWLKSSKMANIHLLKTVSSGKSCDPDPYFSGHVSIDRPVGCEAA